MARAPDHRAERARDMFLTGKKLVDIANELGVQSADGSTHTSGRANARKREPNVQKRKANVRKTKRTLGKKKRRSLLMRLYR